MWDVTGSPKVDENDYISVFLLTFPHNTIICLWVTKTFIRQQRKKDYYVSILCERSCFTSSL